jgi:hypothetical protein
MSVYLFRGCKGSATIESLASLSMMTMFFVLFAAAMYIVLAKVVVSHYGYEALICIAEDQHVHVCKRRILEKLEQALPIGKVSTFQLQKRGYRFRIKLKWQLTAPIANRITIRTLSYVKTLKYQRGF